MIHFVSYKKELHVEKIRKEKTSYCKMIFVQPYFGCFRCLTNLRGIYDEFIWLDLSFFNLISYETRRHMNLVLILCKFSGFLHLQDISEQSFFYCQYKKFRDPVSGTKYGQN